MFRYLIHSFLALSVVILIVSCSKGASNPTTPLNDSVDLPRQVLLEPGHNLVGIGELKLDPANLSGEVVPRRDLADHMNITSFLPSPTIQITGFDAVTSTVFVNFTINNPYTITGYDVRLILFTNNEGLVLKNDDGWITLYDVPGGDYKNPFRAFKREISHRMFAGQTSDTEPLEIHLPSPSGAIVYAIDASYPNNALEPYMIDDFSYTDLFETSGSTAQLAVRVFDWQDNITTVSLNAQVINGSYYTTFTYDPSDYHWKASITNSQSAPAGSYNLMIIANSSDSSLTLYDYVTLTILAEGCPEDSNQNCTTATTLGLNEILQGCIDPNVDPEDWYEILVPPNGITSGTIDLTVTSGDAMMITYTSDYAEACPGVLLSTSNHVVLPASLNSRYSIRVLTSTQRTYYRVTTHLTPAITNIPAEVYVATSGAPNNYWPIHELPGPDEQLTLATVNQMVNWANLFWNQYGYNLTWDGSVTTMASQYYILNSSDESWQMHQTYGKGKNKAAIYFVDKCNDGIETAYTVPASPITNHNVDNVYTVYSPNVWYWQNVIAHEHGHAIGYYFDQYLFDYFGVACGNEAALPSGLPKYLYSDPAGCYNGNLMFYSIDGWNWDRYDLTKGQENYINWFHNKYPNNWRDY